MKAWASGRASALRAVEAIPPGKQSVDLMGSDPLLTVIEAKFVDFFVSTPVMKGSDPITSTTPKWPGVKEFKGLESFPQSNRVFRRIIFGLKDSTRISGPP